MRKGTSHERIGTSVGLANRKAGTNVLKLERTGQGSESDERSAELEQKGREDRKERG